MNCSLTLSGTDGGDCSARMIILSGVRGVNTALGWQISNQNEKACLTNPFFLFCFPPPPLYLDSDDNSISALPHTDWSPSAFLWMHSVAHDCFCDAFVADNSLSHDPILFVLLRLSCLSRPGKDVNTKGGEQGAEVAQTSISIVCWHFFFQSATYLMHTI